MPREIDEVEVRNAVARYLATDAGGDFSLLPECLRVGFRRRAVAILGIVRGVPASEARDLARLVLDGEPTSTELVDAAESLARYVLGRGVR